MIFNFKNTTHLLFKIKLTTCGKIYLYFYLGFMSYFFSIIYIYISDKCKNLTIVDKTVFNKYLILILYGHFILFLTIIK